MSVDTLMPALFPERTEAENSPAVTTGLLPSQLLREAVARREIRAIEPITEEQFQPASIDLRLGDTAYRVPASFLPGPAHTVADRLRDLQLYTLDLRDGAVLERGCVYIVPLLEQLALRYRTSADANPKSSTGRLDVFARVITDHATEFDRIEPNYQGPMYLELSPRTFSVLVRKGSRLAQMRVRRGTPPTSAAQLRKLHEEVGFFGMEPGAKEAFPGAFRGGLAVTVDVKGQTRAGFVGYRARRHTGVIDVDRVDHYDVRDYWEPVYVRRGRGITLDPGEFYILASREAVIVPVNYAAQMIAYDTLVGEFRVHYAGFFDPGFGAEEAGGRGSRAVLEVRSHEVPFLIEHRQVVGRLVYERLIARPDKLYGGSIGSSYQRQGLALSKHFKKTPLR